MNLLNQARAEISRLLGLVNKAEGNKKDYYELLKVIWSENKEYIVLKFPRCYGMVSQKTEILTQYLEEQNFNNIEVGEDYLVIPLDSNKNDLALILLMFCEEEPKSLKNRGSVALEQLQTNLDKFVLITTDFHKGDFEKVFGQASIIRGTSLMLKLWEHEGYDIKALDYHSKQQVLPTFRWINNRVTKVALDCGNEDYNFEVLWVDSSKICIETINTDVENHRKFRNYIASLALTRNTSLGCYGDFINLARSEQQWTLNNPEFDNGVRLGYIFQKIADVTKLGLSNGSYIEVSMNELDGLAKEYLRLRDLLKSLD